MIRKTIPFAILCLYVFAMLSDTTAQQQKGPPALHKTESPTVTLPPEIGAKSGAFIVINAQTDCSQVKWYSVDSGLTLLPPELLRDSKTTIAIAQAGGRYRVLAWAAKGDIPSEIAVCTIVVDGAPPGPPPAPDTFTPALKAAWVVETSTTRNRDKEFLAALYRSGKAVAGTCKTANEFQTKMNAAAENQALGIPGKLMGLRRICWAEIVRVALPAENTPIDAATLKVLGEVLDKIALGLDGLK